MLHSRNLGAVLAQCITPDTPSDKSIVSSILITPSGQAIASYHCKRPPPPPKTSPSGYQFLHDYENNPISPNGIVRGSHLLGDHMDGSTLASDENGTVSSNNSSQLTSFQVSRSGKTKVYALFASSAWKEYQQAGMSKVVLTPLGVAPLSTPPVAGVDEEIKKSSSRPSSNSKDSSKHAKRHSKHQSKEAEAASKKGEKRPKNERDWISLTTDDASGIGVTIFIMKLQLKESHGELLLVLVGDGDCPLGIILKKAEETAAILEEGLSEYKLVE